MMYPHRVFVRGRRSFKRWDCNIPVDYVVNRQAHLGFIHNISSSGAFIGDKEQPDKGDTVVMTFLWKKPIKSSGTVVRHADHGFAVRFTEPLAG